jgi:hypothetical protein
MKKLIIIFAAGLMSMNLYAQEQVPARKDVMGPKAKNYKYSKRAEVTYKELYGADIDFKQKDLPMGPAAKNARFEMDKEKLKEVYVSKEAQIIDQREENGIVTIYVSYPITKHTLMGPAAKNYSPMLDHIKVYHFPVELFLEDSIPVEKEVSEF